MNGSTSTDVKAIISMLINKKDEKKCIFHRQLKRVDKPPFVCVLVKDRGENFWNRQYLGRKRIRYSI